VLCCATSSSAVCVCCSNRPGFESCTQLWWATAAASELQWQHSGSSQSAAATLWMQQCAGSSHAHTHLTAWAAQQLAGKVGSNQQDHWRSLHKLFGRGRGSSSSSMHACSGRERASSIALGSSRVHIDIIPVSTKQCCAVAQLNAVNVGHDHGCSLGAAATATTIPQHSSVLCWCCPAQTATDYGTYLANEASPLYTSTIVDRCTQKLVEDWNAMRCQVRGVLDSSSACVCLGGG
jgi:hypothetical protein